MLNAGRLLSETSELLALGTLLNELEGIFQYVRPIVTLQQSFLDDGILSFMSPTYSFMNFSEHIVAFFGGHTL